VCLESTCFYVVPVVDSGKEVPTIRATSVAQIANLRASLPLSNIEERFPPARGLGACLARLAGKADLLIGLDNQMWMPRHISSSLMEGDNLQLMQSVLRLAGMLMGRAKKFVHDSPNQGRSGLLFSRTIAPSRTGPDGQSE
jgi:hypothetical protein